MEISFSFPRPSAVSLAATIFFVHHDRHGDVVNAVV